MGIAGPERQWLRACLMTKLASLDRLEREPLIQAKKKSLERELRPDSV